MRTLLLPVLAGIVLCFGVTEQASAYAGLGPLLPMIGNGIILLFAFLITLFGAVAYPLRMAWRKFAKSSKETKTSSEQ